MSLFRRLMLSIVLLVLMLLAANAFVSIYNAQKYFSDQLSVVAEDTATSLGLTLSHAAQSDDLAQINSMIDVIFDRGYYRDIVYRNFDGDALVSRHRKIVVEGVPDWFISLIPIEANQGQAEVLSGWMRLGVIEVDIHPGYAYRDLWRVVYQQVWLFLFATVLSWLLAGLGLKLLLRPLLYVERQAEAICRKEFPIQSKLPNTPELKRMVLAMNRMVQKIQAMFAQQVDLTEALRRESHMDALTELPNRKEFDARLNAWMKSEVGGAPSILFLLHIQGLDRVNDTLGRDQGDSLVMDVAGVIQSSLEEWPDMIPSRRSGGDFSVFLPGVLESEVIPILDDLKQKMEDLDCFTIDLTGLDDPISFEFGVSSTQSACDGMRLLSAADISMREMSMAEGSEWRIHSVEDKSEEIRPAGEWRQYLQSALSNHSLILHYQPVMSADGASVIHYESYARIQDEGKLLNAGVFWPLVERYGFADQMDRAIVALVLRKISATDNVQFCVNLSPQALTNKAFQSWLLRTLAEFSDCTSRLTLELPEKVLRLPLSKIKAFVDSLKRFGVLVSLDHFGVTPSSLGVLQSLPFDCVKIDRRFTLDIDAHTENRFYIKSLLHIAQSCDVRVIAEGIEGDRDWQVLLNLGIDGGQGYLFAPPSEDIG